MKHWLAHLTTNQKLAVTALVLGAGAIAATPTSGITVKVNAVELARTVARGEDRVEPRRLADWIVQGNGVFRLLDLRDEAAYAEYRIPGAENVSLQALAGGLDVPRNERVVLYCEDGSQSAHAWVLLRGRGYSGAYVLAGGLDGWKREVLFPVLRENPTAAERQENDSLASLAARFGGAPRAASAAGAPGTSLSALMPAMPMVQPPPPPAGKPAATRKKREGC